MKFGVILVTICAVVLLGAGFAGADEISDLKDQLKALQETVNSLNSKIQNLETKQENQAKEIAKPSEPDLHETVNALNAKIQTLEAKQETQDKEIKKVPELAKKVSGIDELRQKTQELLGGVSIGAHLKFAILDQTQGKRNGINQSTALSGGFVGSHNFILYIAKELEDWLKIDIQPEVDVSASATPSLGSNITRTTSSSTSIKLHQAFMTVRLPKGYELKVGTFNAMYSEDYAKESWWQDLYNMNVGKCSLVAWHDSGAELYKNFDFDKWSLPVYFSVLGGGSDQNVDNNDAKTVLLHVAPEFFQSRFRLLGSIGYGKWSSNKDSYKSLAGFDWKYKQFNLLGEYIYQVFDNVLLPASGTSPTAMGTRKGYWLRAVYTFSPKWKALVESSYANLYKAGTAGQTGMWSDKWYSTSLALDYSLTPNSTIISQYERGDGSRSDGSEHITFDRFTMGWRTTF